MTDALSLRQRIGFYLEDVETPIGRAVSWLVTSLVLLSSAIFVAETYSLPDGVRSQLDVLDRAILLIFAVEYGLRLWCAENPLRYSRSLYAIIDLLAISPLFVGVLDIRFIRLFRWFRILRLVRFFEGRTIVGYVTSEDSAILARIVLTLFSIVFVFAGLIYQVEHPANPEKFSTFLDALYFCVATMTTVGFGDVTPISEMGRLLTILMILTGITLIPWQLGDLVKRLVKASNQIERPCTVCGLMRHDADAQFCKNCGTRLENAACPIDARR